MIYVVAVSVTGQTYLALRYEMYDNEVVGTGEVLAEFRDRKTAVDFCNAWSGVGVTVS